jgi:hypothetical protein
MATTTQRTSEPHFELASMTERLIDEYEGEVAAGSVIRLVARTVQGLRASGVAADRLAVMAEPLVRERLDARGLAG